MLKGISASSVFTVRKHKSTPELFRFTLDTALLSSNFRLKNQHFSEIYKPALLDLLVVPDKRQIKSTPSSDKK